jgi:hypothetical protein
MKTDRKWWNDGRLEREQDEQRRRSDSVHRVHVGALFFDVVVMAVVLSALAWLLGRCVP